MQPLLDVRSVSKSFGAVRSLVDVSLTVEAGGIVGLIGPNGAGKSTLINVLTGVYAPDRGSVAFAGQDLARMGTAGRARQGLVRTFQRPCLIPDLTAGEGVMVGGLARGLARAAARQEALELLALLDMAEDADRPPGALATGRLKLLDLARVLMLRPRLVLLDELMSGLSATETATVLNAVEHLAESGTAFLVVEHLMEVIQRLSRSLVVMDAGGVIAAGDPGQVLHDPRVIDAYLGPGTA